VVIGVRRKGGVGENVREEENCGGWEMGEGIGGVVGNDEIGIDYRQHGRGQGKVSAKSSVSTKREARTWGGKRSYSLRNRDWD